MPGLCHFHDEPAASLSPGWLRCRQVRQVACENFLMQAVKNWPLAARRRITGVFTNIDDTLTTAGAITADALAALGALKAAGLHVIPITGRPVGWSKPFALDWPVDAIVAENGAVALLPHENGLQPLSDGHKLLSKLY